MAEICWNRASYEATVVLIALDERTETWLGTLDASELDGIVVTDMDSVLDGVGGPRREGPATDGGGTPVRGAWPDADAVVLLTRDPGGCDRGDVNMLGALARQSGMLVAAIVLHDSATVREHAALRSLASIREAADNVILPADDRSVVPFLKVLRGGTIEDNVMGWAG
ncbi:hypothetical protein [Rhodococcus sp. NPDC055024]